MTPERGAEKPSLPNAISVLQFMVHMCWAIIFEGNERERFDALYIYQKMQYSF